MLLEAIKLKLRAPLKRQRELAGLSAVVVVSIVSCPSCLRRLALKNFTVSCDV